MHGHMKVKLLVFITLICSTALRDRQPYRGEVCLVRGVSSTVEELEQV
jgi:hypothetical protein